VFPETATSGYFVEGGVKQVAVTTGTLLQDLDRVYREVGGAHPSLDVAIGFYERFQNHFYNSCLYATLGGKKPDVRHVHRKVFLPTYGVFDEERFVDRGQDGVRAFDTSWGGRAAILICEDAWHGLAGTIAALEGAQVIIVPSASPARGTGVGEAGTRLPASMVRWERVVRGLAEEHGVFVVLANLVGFEGGKGFPGASIDYQPFTPSDCLGRPLGSGAARRPASVSILRRKRAFPKAQALFVACRIASISALDNCARKSCR